VDVFGLHSRAHTRKQAHPQDPRIGQQQAKLYDDCLEAQYGGA
jgi:hypothetical protein